MKKVIFALLVCSVFNPSLSAQKKDSELHPIVLKAKETSLYSKEVNWEVVNEKFVDLANGRRDVEGLKESLQYLINSLGDKHAVFRSTKDHAIVVSYTGKIKSTDSIVKIDFDFLNTVINDVTAKFSYQFLDNGIGYLKIVGIGPGDVKEQSDFIRNGLLALRSKGVDKWIVDVRFNGGGNIEPMISGLAPLIGEGFVGGAINADNEIRDYKIENGQLFNYGRLACKMDVNPVLDPNEKVVVLLSRYTVSSGEMLAIAFKGRQHTIFIGEPTAGYTTGNGYDKVTEELALVISQDIFIDRNKLKYENRVDVDEHIEFQHRVALANDNQVNRAIEWLNQ